MPLRNLILFLLCAAYGFAADPSATVVSPFHAEPAAAPTAVAPVAVTVHQEVPLSRDVLTNEGVVALADAGYSPAFLTEKIGTTPRTHFDTTVDGLTYLRKNAIPEDLVEFMLDPKAHAAAAVRAASPVLVASKVKTKKYLIRVPRVSEPTPMVYVYYGNGSGPQPVPMQASAAPPTQVAVTRPRRFWWR